MKNNLEDKYDAIIVGAGISGLICGCYLAKQGMKTLVIEKNSNVGGCCTSFKAKQFTFDAFAHSLGGLRSGGTIETILSELGIRKSLNVSRHNPSDIIVAPDHKIYFWADVNKTVADLQKVFPAEVAHIQDLIDYLAYSKGENTISLMNSTFLDLLNNYIKDDRLKSILSMPVFGNAGLPPSLISAFTAAKLYQEFHLDGGYYPDGGMQVFSDLLASYFQEVGGVILVSKTVEKILIDKNKRAYGVRIKNGKEFIGNYIVSNCDVSQTFCNLIDEDFFDKPNVKNMEPSLSFFSVFVGTDQTLSDLSKEFEATVWYMYEYDIANMYKKAKNGDFEKFSWFMIHGSPDKKGFVISILAPFKDAEYWEKNKDEIADKLISLALKEIPQLKDVGFKFRTVITPQSIFKWTSNLNGAAYGWESTQKQFIVSGLTQSTPIMNFFLTGHWTTQSFGVSGVSYIGRETAKIILGRYDKRKL